MKKGVGIVSGIIGILLVVFGIVMKGKEHSVSIIGGADGPTSIFVAGKTGGNFLNIVIVIGIILTAMGVIVFLKKRNQL